MRTAVIVQARMTSTRLPGKVMRKLAGHTVLEHVLRRAAAIPGVDVVVCATTDGPETDALVAEAGQAGALIFRGSETDVLGRYLGAAEMARAERVMRVTSDCPLIDPTICGEILALMTASGADYACNNMPRSWPHGLDAEAFTIAALRRAANETQDAFDREHVTPWLRRQPDLRRINLPGPGWPYSAQRWTLDHPADLAFFEAVFARLPPLPAMPGLQDVLNLLAAHPEIVKINRALGINALLPHTAARPLAVVRFDAGPEIGGGHAMRCATLEAALQETGWRTMRAVLAPTAAHLGLPDGDPDVIVLQSGNPAGEAEELRRKVGFCELLIVDHYGRDARFEKACRTFARKILAIDDLADRTHDADLLLDATPGRTAGEYRTLLPEAATVLTGPDYALVRGCFRPLRPGAIARRAATRTPQRILVSCGLIDTANATALALQGIAASGLDLEVDVVLGPKAPHATAIGTMLTALNVKGRLHLDAARMAELMAAADLCIGAGGTSAWERCALGLPSLVIGVADNQRPNASALAASGAARILGWIGEIGPVSIARALRELVEHPAALTAMATSAARLVDARGPQRLTMALLGEYRTEKGITARLRLAELADADRLLEWQRAPQTRRFARNPAIPTPEEHVVWFHGKLADPFCWFTILEADGEPAGYLRLDHRGSGRECTAYEVSIAIAPAFHRQGLALATLALGARLMRGNELLAMVLPGNDPSHRLFQAAGYRLGEAGYYRLRPTVGNPT